MGGDGKLLRQEALNLLSQRLPGYGHDLIQSNNLWSLAGADNLLRL